MGSRPASPLPRIIALLLLVSPGPTQAAPPVPPDTVTALQSAFDSHREAESAARRRLALKRITREADQILAAHPDAPNRIEVLGLLFKARQALVTLEDSSRNREALLDTARALAAAPDDAANQRLEADLLVTQTDLARQGADKQTRLDALRPMLPRYRDTPAETRMLRTVLLMALELGDRSLIDEIRETISNRFAGDLEMIAFQRDKLGGQVFGAPFCGTFKRSDGTTAHYPADGLGQSTGLYFWSAKDGGLDDLQRFATAWHERRDELAGQVNLVSFNLDDLPDAGAKILRDLDLPWPALHLPGGTENPYYETFARQTPALLTLSPTGNAALFMAGATRKLSGTTSAQRDYERWFGSTVARSWSRPRYVNQLASLFAGDFFLLDPTAPFDPAFPPEWKAVLPETRPPSGSSPQVPPATLQAIQDCFVPPPVRYRLTHEEIRNHYLEAEKLCTAAEAAHPEAPNLWIVRNRRLVALMGLWKITADPQYFKRAVTCAQAALARNPPPGTALLPRFCLAREALRQPGANPQEVITAFLETLPPSSNRGPALAAAALLALDAGNRGLHEQYRSLILADHLEDPMMWTFGNFLLNRYHRYQIFRAPFVSGRSFGYRQDYFLSHGEITAPPRSLPTTPLPSVAGSPLTLPDDFRGKWTVLLIHGQPVEDKRAPLFRDLSYLLRYATERPLDDLQVVVLLTADDLAATRPFLKESPLDCPTLTVPGGPAHPLLQRLGILSEDETSNLVLLDPEGRVVAMASGLTMQTKARDRFVPNLMAARDEARVLDALDKGNLERARELAFTLAPPDPNREQDNKTKKPVHHLSHLRARARVHLALGDAEAALADAREVVTRQTENDAAMSFRTEDLDEAEALRELILGQAKPGRN